MIWGNTNEPEESGKKTDGIVVKKKHLLVAGIVAALLIAAAVTVGLNWNNWFGRDAPSGQAGKLDIDPGAGEWTQSAPPGKDGGSSAGIAIPGYPSIKLPANTKEVQVALLNPEGNPCYFQFEIVLKDGGESLYQSKLVPPGKAVTNLTLSRGLAAGEYEATIQIFTTSLSDGQTPMNGANVETILIVQ